ncbi:DUF1580 domain-containing protein [Candidatus Laterigemmans baculatus]|uniref:DUF1580 domain-containing protein n=1 Tax=Candidatus Laterigemmans baculatus TaxID=2770505 RepID=UPI0013DD19CD|nr:DUF1580 domain-containing protein [Candidatus Laterigemmans baculatus]
MRSHQHQPNHFLRAGEAARVVEQITGERPHSASIHRWASRGLRGVKLRTIYAMGARRTTEKWIREFFESVAAAAEEGQAAPATEPDRLAAIQKAEQALDSDGISPGSLDDPPVDTKRRRVVRRRRRS